MAATTFAAVVGFGLWWSGAFARATRDRMAKVAQERAPAAGVADVRRHLEQRARYDPTRFVADAKDDAVAFGLPPEAARELTQPQVFRALLDAPQTLRSGQEWRASPLRVRASHEKVRYQRHGAMVAAKHLVATVENIGDRPLAYRIELRPVDRGRCEVRGARMHNAIALRPDERAEIVVCAGGGQLRIERAEVLETSALGYAYLSKLSPLAVGQDGIAAGAHAPDRRFARCSAVDTTMLTSWLHDGLVRWVDLVDFFSRHNCDRFTFFPTYRYTGGVRALPVEDSAESPG